MMAAIIRQLMPGQALGKQRGFAHVPGRLGTPRRHSGVGHVPHRADQGGNPEQPERREQQPGFDILIHRRFTPSAVVPPLAAITGWPQRDGRAGS